MEGFGAGSITRPASVGRDHSAVALPLHRLLASQPPDPDAAGGTRLPAEGPLVGIAAAVAALRERVAAATMAAPRVTRGAALRCAVVFGIVWLVLLAVTAWQQQGPSGADVAHRGGAGEGLAGPHAGAAVDLQMEAHLRRVRRSAAEAQQAEAVVGSLPPPPPPPPQPQQPAAPAIRPATEADQARLAAEGSSVWCAGGDVNTRRCTFQQLCYAAAHGDFVFLHGRGTVMDGVPADRTQPALANLASVNDHNVQYFNFVDLPAHAIAKFNVTYVDGRSLLFRRFKPDNVMHVFHDDLMPLFHTLREMSAPEGGGGTLDRSIRLVALEGWQRGPFAYLYETLFTDEPMLTAAEFPKDSMVCFRNAHVGLSRLSTWYDYGFSSPQGPIKGKNVSGSAVRQFADHFRVRFGIHASPAPQERGIVLFTRKRNRFLTNEKELIAELEAKFRRTVTVLSMEAYAVEEQAAVMSNAGVAIGLHGSILILSLFLPPGGILVELYPFAVPSQSYTPYRTLVQLKGLDLEYAAWENRHESNTITHVNYPKSLGGISHLPPEEQIKILKTKTVPMHICCTDPFWLFRIYQDTRVEIGELLGLLTGRLQGRAWLWPAAASDGPYVEHRIMPSQVEGVGCVAWVPAESGTGDSNNLHIRIEWRPAWNAQYFRSEVYYEVWVQELNKAWRTTDPSVTITGDDLLKGSSYILWVRGVGEQDTKGPFSQVYQCVT